jgi:hypothetical protein
MNKNIFLKYLSHKNNIEKNLTIHTIGDSHSYAGWKDVINHHIGPVLCYSFGRDKLNRCDIRNFLNIKNGDTLIFCFGEIDCRYHIHKYVSQINTYQIIIDNIIKNYIDAIKLNIEISQLKLKNICIYNVVPPIPKNNLSNSNEYQLIGSDEKRKNYVLYFNKKLKEKCIENNFIFFDIYNYYTDDHGFLNKDLSDGNVHIGNGKYIIDFINKFLKN